MDIVDSPLVHDEIRELAARVKEKIINEGQMNEQNLLENIKQNGLTEGTSAMMRMELEAAEWSIETGLYAVFRPGQVPGHKPVEDCIRIGPTTICFCGHPLSHHNTKSRKVPCGSCKCDLFEYMASFPEQLGQYWLPNREGFDLSKWAPKCTCKHTHKDHSPIGSRRCKECPCGSFVSDFCCVVCDKKWEEHETVFEGMDERRDAGRPIGQAYKPLSQVDPEFFDLVFNPETPIRPPPERLAIKPAPKPKRKAATASWGGGGCQVDPEVMKRLKFKSGGPPGRGRGAGRGGRGPPPAGSA